MLFPVLPCHVLPCPVLPCPPLRHTPFPPSALPWHLPSTLFRPLPYRPTCPPSYRLLRYSPALQLFLQHQSFCDASQSVPAWPAGPPPCQWHYSTLTFIFAILVLPCTHFSPCPFAIPTLSCALPSHMPPAHPMPYSSLPGYQPRPTMPCPCSCIILHYKLPCN